MPGSILAFIMISFGLTNCLRMILKILTIIVAPNQPEWTKSMVIAGGPVGECSPASETGDLPLRGQERPQGGTWMLEYRVPCASVGDGASPSALCAEHSQVSCQFSARGARNGHQGLAQTARMPCPATPQPTPGLSSFKCFSVKSVSSWL